jgi:hypothetical protein
MCLSTSSALVCWVKLLVRTDRRALAAASACSLRHVNRACHGRASRYSLVLGIGTRTRTRTRGGPSPGSLPLPLSFSLPRTHASAQPTLVLGRLLRMPTSFLLGIPIGQLDDVDPPPRLAQLPQLEQLRKPVKRDTNRSVSASIVDAPLGNTHGREVSSSLSPSSSETWTEVGVSVSGDFSRTRGCGRRRLLIIDENIQGYVNNVSLFL